MSNTTARTARAFSPFFFGKSILSVSVLFKKCVTLHNFIQNLSAAARFSSFVILLFPLGTTSVQYT